MLTGVRRHAAEALQEVKENPFGLKEFGSRAFDFSDRGAGGDELTIIGKRLGVTAAAVGGKDHIQQAEAGEDHGATGDHAGAGAGGADEQGRGGIAGAEWPLREA
jgi:hypothetical protein